MFDICQQVHELALARKAVDGPHATLELHPQGAPPDITVVYAYRECEDPTRWAREFWERPEGLLDDEHVLERRTLEACHSLLRAVLQPFEPGEHPRLQRILVERFIQTQAMGPWENIVWRLVRDEEGVITDVRTTLNVTQHRLIPALSDWLRAPEPEFFFLSQARETRR